MAEPYQRSTLKSQCPKNPRPWERPGLHPASAASAAGTGRHNRAAPHDSVGSDEGILQFTPQLGPKQQQVIESPTPGFKGNAKGHQSQALLTNV
jgi:hypothetical protein